MSVGTGEKKKGSASLAPFCVEARTPRNQDVIVLNLAGLRLRGAVSASMEAFDRQWESMTMDDGDDEDWEGEPTRPVSARLIEGVGEMPGERLFVYPEELRWRTEDPLRKQDGLLERIKDAIARATGLRMRQRFRGMPPRNGTVGRDEMKTLCREILGFVEAGEMRLIKGAKPTREGVDGLPGDYLLCPFNPRGIMQPRYEKDRENWAMRLAQLK